MVDTWLNGMKLYMEECQKTEGDAMKCNSCVHSSVCKKYPSENIPPESRKRIMVKLDLECADYHNTELCVMLPCKIGSDVYIIANRTDRKMIRRV